MIKYVLLSARCRSARSIWVLTFHLYILREHKFPVDNTLKTAGLPTFQCAGPRPHQNMPNMFPGRWNVPRCGPPTNNDSHSWTHPRRRPNNLYPRQTPGRRLRFHH